VTDLERAEIELIHDAMMYFHIWTSWRPYGQHPGHEAQQERARQGLLDKAKKYAAACLLKGDTK
jgi:hypothetical protein